MESTPAQLQHAFGAGFVFSSIIWVCLVLWVWRTHVAHLTEGAKFHYRRGYRDGAHSNLPLS